ARVTRCVPRRDALHVPDRGRDHHGRSRYRVALPSRTRRARVPDVRRARRRRAHGAARSARPVASRRTRTASSPREPMTDSPEHSHDLAMRQDEVDPDLLAPTGGAARELTRRQLAVLCAIAAGGALGTPARYAVGRVVHVAPSSFPWPTFLV